jgi:tetratricopeptide (TPR) repeat protein
MKQIRGHRRPYATCTRSAIIVLASLVALVGCSLPRIIIINDPLSIEEHNNLGRIYESQGKFELAAQQYRAALKKDPRSASSLLLLGDLSCRTKNYSEARSAYTAAMKLQPENGDIYNNLAQVYLEQNVDIEKAEDLVRRSLALYPIHRAYYLDTLGIVLLRQGRIAESLVALQESAALLPKDNAVPLAEAYEHLAEAYRAAGDSAHADEAGQTAEKYRARK